jgi:hypothetical protein
VSHEAYAGSPYVALSRQSVACECGGFIYFRDRLGDASALQSLSSSVASHVFLNTRSYTVRVRATDKDGGVSAETSKTITIKVAELQPDPAVQSRNILAFGGSSGKDKIRFTNSGGRGAIQVMLNCRSQGAFRPNSLIVFGQSGNDDIEVTVGISLPAALFGGAGIDRLKAGSGQSVLIGGAGKDVLTGGSKADLLIGGAAADKLDGAAGGDILVGDAVSFQEDTSALAARMQEWTRPEYELSVTCERSVKWRRPGWSCFVQPHHLDCRFRPRSAGRHLWKGLAVASSRGPKTTLISSVTGALPLAAEGPIALCALV